MGRSFLVLLIFVSFGALADFYSPTRVPLHLRPAGYEPARLAALEVGAAGDRKCSGTIISREGHVLTALHCVRTCAGLDVNESIRGFKYRVPNARSIGAGRSCEVEVRLQNGRSSALRGTLVAAGPGYVEVSDANQIRASLSNNPARQQLFMQAMAAGVGVPGDFAIVKVGSLSGKTCARLSTATVIQGSRVWNISYPKKSRRSGSGAPGDEQVFASGSVVRVTNAPIDYSFTTVDRLLQLRNQRPEMISSSIDSNVGSSGSALFNERGEVVAVLNASGVSESDMSSKDKWQGTRYAASSEFIRRHVTQVYGINTAAAAFNCQ